MPETSLMEGIQEMIQVREDDLQPKRERFEYIVKTLEASTDKVRRLVDELSDFEGETVKAAIKEKVNYLETERKMLTEEKGKLATELAQVEIPPDIEKRVAKIASKVRERLPNATFDGRRELLELLAVKVIFHNTDDNAIRLHVSCMLPDSEEDIALSSS